ncbi:MAG: glycosyltransferase family 2 protein [Treponema sp.]|jgi:glycosyltransferase involved in cell wall biosynthesis|nr:glycosyltransferase family 2 protein [Treponema sp.]
MPAITVAMPAYNAETHIKTAMENALSQTFSDFELLTVNDGSQDRTKEAIKRIAEGDRRVVLLSRADNQGVAVARRSLAENARGEYVFWLDADDRMEPDALEALSSAAKEKDADIVFFGEAKHERKGLTRRSYCPPDDLSRLIKHALKRNAVSMRPFIKTSLLRRCVIPPTNYGEDMALAIQGAVLAGKRAGLPRFLYHYNYNPRSICHAVRSQARNQRDLIAALEWTGAFLMERGYMELAEIAFKEMRRVFTPHGAAITEGGLTPITKCDTWISCITACSLKQP